MQTISASEQSNVIRFVDGALVSGVTLKSPFITNYCGYVMVTVIYVSAVPGVIGQSLLMQR